MNKVSYQNEQLEFDNPSEALEAAKSLALDYDSVITVDCTQLKFQFKLKRNGNQIVMVGKLK